MRSLLIIGICVLSLFVLGGRKRKLPSSSDPSTAGDRARAAAFFRAQPNLQQPQPPVQHAPQADEPQLQDTEHLTDLVQTENSEADPGLQMAENLLQQAIESTETPIGKHFDLLQMNHQVTHHFLCEWKSVPCIALNMRHPMLMNRTLNVVPRTPKSLLRNGKKMMTTKFLNSTVGLLKCDALYVRKQEFHVR